MDSKNSGLGFIVLTGLVLGVLGGCSTTPTDNNGTPPLSFAAIAGEWVGIVTEVRNNPVQYPVQVVVGTEAQANQNAGTVVYANDLCGGNLVARSAAGNEYAFRETLTFGLSNCGNNATVRLTHDAAAGTLSYEWYSFTGGVLGAIAVLTRK